jgi:hypothetical protein
MNAEHPDSDPVDQACQGRAQQCDHDGGQESHAPHQGRDQEPGHRRDGRHRQVDAARQHGQRLGSGEDRQRDRQPKHGARPVQAHEARLEQLEGDDQEHQQADERDDRLVPEERPHAADAGQR